MVFFPSHLCFYKLFIFKNRCKSVYGGGSVPMRAVPQRSQRTVSDALELELQVVESHENWRLGIELGSPVT